MIPCRSLRSTVCPSPSATCRFSTRSRSRSMPESGSPSSAATARASRRCCRSSAAICQPDAGLVLRQPGVRVARLVQDVPLSADRTVAEVVGEGLGPLDAHDEWQRHHQADMVMSRLSLPPAGDCRHAVRRMETPRPAGAGAGRPARSAAPRRAHQSPRYRGDHLARIIPRRVPGRGRVRHARSRVPRAARDAHRRTRSRPADVVARRLRRRSSARRKSGSRTRSCSTPSSTRRWPARKCGCAAASRRGGRATRAASRR